MNNNFSVALCKEACPACGALVDGPIVMNRTLTAKEAERVDNLHGKCIGFSNHLCDKCKEYCSQGLLLIEIDSEKSEKNNPYRTGKIYVIKSESDFAKYIKEHKFTISIDNCEFCFIDKNVIKNIL